jgi:hypothetical protein
MSSAGTNGTDLTSTLTTQGDIIYRNASGLARLGAGTNGQVLTTAGASANPSWTTVSSDVVKLASVSTTSTHSTIDINGYFNDTIYSHYKLALHSVKGENTTGDMTAKFLTSSSTTNDANNYLVLHTGYTSGTTGQQDRGYQNVNNTSDLNGTWNERQSSSSDTSYSSYICHIYNPQSTTQGKCLIYQGFIMTSVGNVQVTVNGGYFSQNTTAMTGFRFFRTGGGFYQSAWSLYGFKK